MESEILTYILKKFVVEMVGMTGLEPATPKPPAWCATRLRYIPKKGESIIEKD
jgi:hypothetical protein